MLYAVADDLQDRLESLPGVLEANLQGKREEIAEIIVDPTKMDSPRSVFCRAGTLGWYNNLLVASRRWIQAQGVFRQSSRHD